ncbi:MAG: tetratricopeptide repeat protein [Acetobacteraceae bacterium]|nr:tetratricopeptide repeat protein [Acetobacteraceae bacterium]
MCNGAALSFAAAFAHLEAGRLNEARTLCCATLTRDPNHPEALHLLGLIVAQQGEPEAGAAMIQRAMALTPGRAPHHNSLALVWRLLGRHDGAVREYRAAAALRPGSAEIHNNLATALRDLGRHREAVEEYRHAASCAPERAEIWCNLASTLDIQGDPPDVEACFRRAIALRPDYAAAHAGFGRWLIARGRWVEAEACLREAVRLAPDDAAAWTNLGIAPQETGRAAEAEACYRHAIALDPGRADAHHNLGCLLAADGRTDEAIACHEAALIADPLHGAARLALCMAELPILYRDDAEVDERRARYLKALDRLETAVTEPPIAAAVAAAIGTSQPFFLPYQGENDVAPQTLYGRLACRVLAASALPARSEPGKRIRVGIVSGFFQDHTIFRLFLEGWLTQIDRRRFEVIGFHTGRGSDAETARAASWCDRFTRDLPSAAAWREAVSEAAPHVLLYPEVGMDPMSGRLAAQRLAPVQCVAWGHPVTTGFPTMDYFLSSELMEPPDGDAHYTERLIRLPGLGVYYVPDGQPSGRAAPHIAPGVPVYWSGQALYKYLPQYDAIFPRIATAVGDCRFVFIGFAKSQAVTDAFRARLARAFATFGLDADRYCVVLPPMPQEQFLAAAGAADVILDTPGWSGGRSTLDCLAVNPAIVTWPGPFMRGRHTAAILRQIGCEETIAESLDHYVDIAVRLGRDTAWRDCVRGSVEQHKYRAFRDDGPVRALEMFLVGALKR